MHAISGRQNWRLSQPLQTSERATERELRVRFFRFALFSPYIHLHNSTGFYYSILPFDGGIDDGPNGVVDCDEPFFPSILSWYAFFFCLLALLQFKSSFCVIYSVFFSLFLCLFFARSLSLFISSRWFQYIVVSVQCFVSLPVLLLFVLIFFLVFLRKCLNYLDFAFLSSIRMQVASRDGTGHERNNDRPNDLLWLDEF